MGVKDYYEDYWDRDTDVSDSDVTTPARKQRLLAQLRRCCRPGDKVLDLGCGAGSFTAVMQQAGYNALGMDLSENAIAFARRKYPDYNFRLLAPDGSIPAPSSSFDAVWTTEVIEHVLQVDAFLEEIRRVLRPGGALVLTTPYHGLIKNLFIVLVKFDRHFEVDGSHIRFFNKRALDRCLTKSGFQPSSYGGIGRTWPIHRSWFVVAKRAA